MARDIDQRCLAHRRGRRDHFGGEQEGERGGSGDEALSDQPHHALARDTERERHRALRRDHPEADLADLVGNRQRVACSDIA